MPWDPWQSKPPQGTPLNGFNGLTQGLSAFWALLEGGGPATADLVGQVSAISASVTPWGSGLTSGLLCTTNGTGLQGNLPASLQLQPPLTMAIGFRLVSTPVVSCPVLGSYDGGTNTRILALETGSTLTINFTVASGTLLAKSLSLGTDYVAVVTAASGNSSLYVNDVLAQNSANTYTVSYSSPTIQLGGVSFASGGRNPGSLIYWAALWNRFLTAGEIAAVSSNPWRMCAPNPSYWLYKHASAGPSYRPWIFGDQIESNGQG